MIKLNRSTWIILTVIEMIAIVYLSVRPEAPGHGPSLPWEVFHKFGHLMAYGVLTYLYLQCFGYFNRKLNQILFKAFSIAVLFGAFNEFLQLFCPTRSARWWDVLVNAIGAGVVIFIVKRIRLGLKVRVKKPVWSKG